MTILNGMHYGSCYTVAISQKDGRLSRIELSGKANERVAKIVDSLKLTHGNADDATKAIKLTMIKAGEYRGEK